MDLRLFACALAVEGFRVCFGAADGDKQRPWVARRGQVLIHGVPGQPPRMEIAPRRFTISP